MDLHNGGFIFEQMDLRRLALLRHSGPGTSLIGTSPTRLPLIQFCRPAALMNSWIAHADTMTERYLLTDVSCLHNPRQCPAPAEGNGEAQAGGKAGETEPEADAAGGAGVEEAGAEGLEAPWRGGAGAGAASVGAGHVCHR